MQKTKSKNLYLSVFIFILVSFLFYLHHKKYIDLLGFNKKPADMLFEKCADKMANDLCAIMGTSPNFSPEVNQIYLPSYGPLDANLYRTLLRAGPGMCQLIKEECLKDMLSDLCKLGNGLYSSKN